MTKQAAESHQAGRVFETPALWVIPVFGGTCYQNTPSKVLVLPFQYVFFYSVPCDHLVSLRWHIPWWLLNFFLTIYWNNQLKRQQSQFVSISISQVHITKYSRYVSFAINQQVEKLIFFHTCWFWLSFVVQSINYHLCGTINQVVVIPSLFSHWTHQNFRSR